MDCVLVFDHEILLFLYHGERFDLLCIYFVAFVLGKLWCFRNIYSSVVIGTEWILEIPSFIIYMVRMSAKSFGMIAAEGWCNLLLENIWSVWED